MATAESVKAKIQGLINTVNSTTGGADTDLTAAVNALIAGFGQGGGEAEWKKIASYTPATATYLTSLLFNVLEITASYSSGIIVSYGNSDISTQGGNFKGVFIYTPTEIQCFVEGAYNGSAGQFAGKKYTRTEQGIGGLFGSENVGNVRSGYVVVGATYNVYECSLPDVFAEKVMSYIQEEA